VQKPPLESSGFRRARIDTSMLLGAEFLVVAIPLFVLLFVLWVQGRSAQILSSPEWSFGAVVLIGQTVIRVVAFAVSTTGRPRWQRIVGTVAFLLVLGFVPALLILFLALLAAGSSMRLAAAQLAMFTWASVLFFGVGHAAQLGIAFPGLLRKLKDLRGVRSQNSDGGA